MLPGVSSNGIGPDSFSIENLRSSDGHVKSRFFRFLPFALKKRACYKLCRRIYKIHDIVVQRLSFNKRSP